MNSQELKAYKEGYSRIDWSVPVPKSSERAYIPPARSDLACPMFNSDTMDPVEHVDGKFYTSKSQYRAVTKAHGYIEVGNDPARHKRPLKPKPDRKAIKEAVAKAVAQHSN